jgi:hypothetical protein
VNIATGSRGTEGTAAPPEKSKSNIFIPLVLYYSSMSGEKY